ncbi:hypothetical protein XENTR_v10018685 [Xenopus tropicalis]|nr:hypothetical protein XENTR_v10018685 [Xenopus tropicalis]
MIENLYLLQHGPVSNDRKPSLTALQQDCVSPSLHIPCRHHHNHHHRCHQSRGLHWSPLTQQDCINKKSTKCSD